MIRIILPGFLFLLTSTWAFAQEDLSHQHVSTHCSTTAEYGPGDACFMHDVFHRSYKPVYRALNAAWIDQHVADEETFDRLYALRHQVNLVNGDDSGQLGPGDYDFMNDELRSLYVQMYKNTKCHCNYGSCRPTSVRLATEQEKKQYRSDTFSDYMVYVDDAWKPVPSDVLNHENSIPVDLWERLMGPIEGMVVDGLLLNGHVCQLQSGWLECVMVPRLHG